ncbi:thermonuclease family protein [Vineibacter terrae]|uniref:thermonuclease family protein n=1 Tax=Vineibacter terrae TaxID=2586908 RepID=UPI0015B5D78F|nr:thermonuclease family protein [Vineibacter terrae]
MIIAGRALRCSGERRDQYRRPLVTCQAGETDIGRELVRAGWAVALPTPDYAVEEAEARSEGRGLWQGSFQRPDEPPYRCHRTRCPGSDEAGGRLSCIRTGVINRRPTLFVLCS